ncbi:MAG: hypothetical protein ACYCPP_03150 [Nitrososphaerales archaeon]
MSKASLELIYKEVKSMNKRLDLLEDLVEEVVVSNLPKARLSKQEERQMKRRLSEMRRGERATLEEMKRA